MSLSCFSTKSPVLLLAGFLALSSTLPSTRGDDCCCCGDRAASAFSPFPDIPFIIDVPDEGTPTVSFYNGTDIPYVDPPVATTVLHPGQNTVYIPAAVVPDAAGTVQIVTDSETSIIIYPGDRGIYRGSSGGEFLSSISDQITALNNQLVARMEANTNEAKARKKKEKEQNAKKKPDTDPAPGGGGEPPPRSASMGSPSPQRYSCEQARNMDLGAQKEAVLSFCNKSETFPGGLSNWLTVGIGGSGVPSADGTQALYSHPGGFTHIATGSGTVTFRHYDNTVTAPQNDGEMPGDGDDERAQVTISVAPELILSNLFDESGGESGSVTFTPAQTNPGYNSRRFTYRSGPASAPVRYIRDQYWLQESATVFHWATVTTGLNGTTGTKGNRLVNRGKVILSDMDPAVPGTGHYLTRLDVLETFEEAFQTSGPGIRTSLRREMVKYKKLPVRGDVPVERQIYASGHTGSSPEVIASHTIYFEDGLFEGRPRISVQADGSWTAHEYPSHAGTWGYDHIIYRPWKDGPDLTPPAANANAATIAAFFNSLASSAKVSKTKESWPLGMLSEVQEYTPNEAATALNQTARTTYERGVDASSRPYTLVKRYIDATSFMAEVTVRNPIQSADRGSYPVLGAGRVAFTVRLKKQTDPATVDWENPSNWISRTAYRYETADAYENISVSPSNTYEVTTVTDETRWPRSISQTWRLMGNGRTVKFLRMIQEQGDPQPAPEVLEAVSYTYDVFGRVSAVQTNGFETDSYTYPVEASASSDQQFWNVKHIGRDGTQTLTWYNYLDQVTRTEDGTLDFTPAEAGTFLGSDFQTAAWAWKVRRTTVTHAPRTGGGRITTTELTCPTETAYTRKTVTETDRMGRTRSVKSFATTAAEELTTYAYDVPGRTVTVSGPVQNGTTETSVTGIHSRQIRYRDGRLWRSYGAKETPQELNYFSPAAWQVASRATGPLAGSVSGKTDGAPPSFDTASAVTSVADGLGRSLYSLSPAPPEHTAVPLYTFYNDEGGVASSEQMGPNGINRLRHSSRSYNDTLAEWTTTSSSSAGGTTGYAPATSYSRLLKINGRWTRVTRNERMNDSGTPEIISTTHEDLGPWPLASDPQWRQWSLTRSYRGDQPDSIGTPASTSKTFVRRNYATTLQETQPDTTTSPAVEVSFNGSALRSRSSSVGASNWVVYDYTALRDHSRTKDARSSQWSLTTYDPATGRVTSERGPGQTVNQATYAYYGPTDWRRGLVKSIQNAAAKQTRYSYDDAGRTTHQWGRASYPSRYVYDASGRMTELHTWRLGTPTNWAENWSGSTTDALPASFGTLAFQKTQWTYHNPTGLMTAKIYPDEDGTGPLLSKSTTWTYRADGQPATRVSPRTFIAGAPPVTVQIITTWNYTDFGQLESTVYNDGTPTASWTYNPHHGRAATLMDAAGTHTYAWRANGLRESETQDWDGPLPAGPITIIDPSYDSKLRRDTFSASIGAQITPVSDWNYSATTGRLAEIVAGARKTVYGYHTGIDRISTRQHYNTTTMVTQTVESLDTKNRIQSVMNSRSAGGYVVLAQSYYSFDSLDRRQTAGREDSTLWEYAYNDRGEVTGTSKKPDPVWSQFFEYAGLTSSYWYDSIGNRTTWTNGGGYADSEEGGLVTRVAGYTANDLNLYTAVTQTVPRSAEVIGRKTTSQSVQVNGTYPYEQTVYGISKTQQFRGVVSDPATSGPGLYKSVTVTRNGVAEYSGVKWLPPVAAVPTYDNEGNLLTDGRWTYTWDAENRLTSMTSPGQQTPAVAQVKLEFTYDAFSRRVSKKVSTRPWTSDNSGTWVEASHERFVYDGWNLAGRWKWIAATSTWTLQQTYIWGPDVGGSYQGAGGVGGLNMILSASGNSWFPCYDGNGNITALVNAVAGGAIDATYDYDAFGQPIRQSGSSALLNPFRFSTKYTDDESELVYYGYRYYDPLNGRWLNKDPIGERGGLNLVAMTVNDSVNSIDILGLAPGLGPVSQEQANRIAHQSDPKMQAKIDKLKKHLAANVAKSYTFNKCGTWNVTSVPVKYITTLEGLQGWPKESGGERNGFNVEYVIDEERDECKCEPPCKLILTQAVAYDDYGGVEPQLDGVSKEQEEALRNQIAPRGYGFNYDPARVPVPPDVRSDEGGASGGNKGNGDYSYQDSPMGDPTDWNTWSIETCASCYNPETNKVNVLGCVRFDIENKSRELEFKGSGEATPDGRGGFTVDSRYPGMLMRQAALDALMDPSFHR